MAEEKQKQPKKKIEEKKMLKTLPTENVIGECNDERCPTHGNLSVRGRTFKGYITKIVGRRAVIEWERIVYFSKYERYARKKSKVHAHIPLCLLPKVKVGNYVKIGECRPLSKIIHFVLLGVIR